MVLVAGLTACGILSSPQRFLLFSRRYTLFVKSGEYRSCNMGARLKLLALMTILVGVVGYIVLNLPRTQSRLNPQPIQLKVGLPARLQIRQINLNVAIESVGLTPQSAMEVPKAAINAGWYNLGPRPGQIGSAVIDGHYGTIEGLPAVFNNLHKLHKGDEIAIQDTEGAVITFTVRGSLEYDPNADSSAIFNSSDGKSHLNIITCDGAWSNVTHSFSQRLVVFADRK